MESNKTLYTWSMCDADGNEFASGEVKEMSEKYIDLGLPSGTLWAACNVGANAPEEYGGHFTWENANKLGVTLPSKTQILELCTKCKSKWTRINNTEGRLFTGLTGNSIFLPAAGIVREDGLLLAIGFDGDYWSSMIYDFKAKSEYPKDLPEGHPLHKDGWPLGYPREMFTLRPYHLYVDMVGAGLGCGSKGNIMQSVRAVKNKDNEPNKQQKQ